MRPTLNTSSFPVTEVVLEYRDKIGNLALGDVVMVRDVLAAVSGYRADLRAKVEVARKSHLERMAKVLPLAMVSRLFPERTRLLLHWFPAVPEPLPTAVPVVVEQARVSYLVPYSAEWLNDRQAKWRKKWRGDFSSGSKGKSVWPRS